MASEPISSMTTVAPNANHVIPAVDTTQPVGSKNQTVTATGLATFTTQNFDAMTYSNVSGKTLSATSATTLISWTQVFDRLGANFNATTGIYTAPNTGYYFVAFGLNYSGSSVNPNTIMNGVISVNGSAVNTIPYVTGAAATFNKTMYASFMISLNSGDTLAFVGDNQSSQSLAIGTNGGPTQMSIAQIL